MAGGETVLTLPLLSHVILIQALAWGPFFSATRRTRLPARPPLHGVFKTSVWVYVRCKGAGVTPSPEAGRSVPTANPEAFLQGFARTFTGTKIAGVENRWQLPGKLPGATSGRVQGARGD